VNPPLFSLVDLLNDKVNGFFYGAQLTKTVKPNYAKDYFFIEKIIKEKTVNGVVFLEVKFLYYSDKFNLFLPKKNLKITSN
jgi:hypothetical protein